jgi:hypothetical protein
VGLVETIRAAAGGGSLIPAARGPAVPAGAAGTAAPAAPGVPAAGAEAVAAAFILGWRLAELYDRDALPPPATAAAATAVPAHLPGASEMTDHTRAVVLLKQASAALAVLSRAVGTELPGLAAVGTVLGRPDHDRDDVRGEIMTAYLAIRGVLQGADPPAATSYGLGRLLADTTYLPRSGQPEILAERFSPFRAACACGWLADLTAAFPRRAAAAVRVSFRSWADWVSGASGAVGAGGPQKAAAADADPFGESALRALHAQGEMWRRLLSGEQDPMQLLGPDDYVAAGERLLQRGRQISRRFLVKWWPGFAVLLAASGAAIWAALTYAPAGSSRLAAVLVSGAAALGLSWKGISATLGKALSQAEAALWAGEVDVATGMAATILPPPPARPARSGRAAR